MVNYGSGKNFYVNSFNYSFEKLSLSYIFQKKLLDIKEFLLFRNLGRDGWEPRVQRVRRRHDLSRWPDVYFSNPQVYVADMNGDRLSDIVTIRSGEVASGRREREGEHRAPIVADVGEIALHAPGQVAGHGEAEPDGLGPPLVA